jgi:hypothetical protein
MRVLHAYICEEYYRNWAKIQRHNCENVSHYLFLKEFGTPMLSFDIQSRHEFFPIGEGGYVRYNPNYHIDCREFRNSLPDKQPSEVVATAIESALQSPTITSIRTRILGWLGR